MNKSPIRICIYAFSSTALFFGSLMELCAKAGDAVEWSIVQPQGHFRYVFDGIIPRDRRCYLYETFAKHYVAADHEREQGALASGDGLVTALMKDKDGYRWLDKDEQLRRGSAMYGVYREFLERIRPDFVLFPDLEVVDGFVLMNLCHELGVGVLYFANLRLIGRSFFGPDSYESLPPYFGDFTNDDVLAARTVIEKFKSRQGNDAFIAYPEALPEKPSWFRRLIVSTYLRHGPERLHASEDTYLNRIARNARGALAAIRRRRFDISQARYFDIRDSSELPGKFVFYALQYTPESSINGLEPYYVDQFRVIDALLLGLPPGYRLVVKEHPAMRGIRSRTYYTELRRKPGLVLAHPAIDSRILIERAAVSATVTGTIGLESYLLDRPCVLFGRNAFAHLCYKAPGLTDLRPFLTSIIDNYVSPTPERKEHELAKLINVGEIFYISDPWYVPTVMAPGNISAARSCLWRHISRLSRA